MNPLEELEVSLFAAEPFLLVHLSFSNHQITPSMESWMMLSLTMSRAFYAEQLTFQWSTTFLLQARSFTIPGFPAEVLGVRALPSLLALSTEGTQVVLPPYPPVVQHTGTPVIFTNFPKGGGLMLGADPHSTSGKAPASQLKCKKPPASTKPHFKILHGASLPA